MGLDNRFLLDGWRTGGRSYEGFKESLKDVTEATTFEKVSMSRLGIGYYVGNYTKRLDQMVFHVYHGKNALTAPTNPRGICESALMKLGDFQPLIREIKRNKFLLVDMEWNGLFFVSTHMWNTFLQRIHVRLEEPSTDMTLAPWLATQMWRWSVEGDKGVKDDTVTLVIRRYDSIAKCFAVHSGKYNQGLAAAKIPSLIDSLDERLKGAECESWEISHSLYRAQMNFPGKALDVQEIYRIPELTTPGLQFSTSDIGTYEFSVQGTYTQGRRTI